MGPLAMGKVRGGGVLAEQGEGAECPAKAEGLQGGNSALEGTIKAFLFRNHLPRKTGRDSERDLILTTDLEVTRQKTPSLSQPPAQAYLVLSMFCLHTNNLLLGLKKKKKKIKS